ncbi:MAG: CRISPR-associated protein Cas4 [Candidatus Kapabacteria bacterium]|nr:CRISPR-associated protein Cas4 [Candidatus Kapabacteria bacterium]MCS7169321.1 CRISPR-associated protein Cas4 [Candidatus Kapabacteria bacterium]MDW7996064.1 CRISPR-associated protein Cas4 [Bacteroidota bacterium]MDW8224922.1 CRISPR-associated protein Cas4 [Bacteroidota bacterium]
MEVVQLSDEEFERIRTNGLLVHYWAICPRKVWLYAKGLRMEPLSERVFLGRLLHERAYPDISRREVLIDQLIKVDLLTSGERLLEVKYSQRLAEAARLQVAYYLLYLRWLGAGEMVGELRFPRARRREEVRLTPELEARVACALKGIQQIEQLPEPPVVDFMPLCRACAYCELCWG